jgi:hypothetical protein
VLKYPTGLKASLIFMRTAKVLARLYSLKRLERDKRSSLFVSAVIDKEFLLNKIAMLTSF